MSAVHSCISLVPIFRDLPEAAQAQLGQAMLHQRFQRGEIIRAAGSPVDAVIVVARGQLKIVHTHPAGREQVVRLIGPGELTGELGLLTPATHEGDIIATTLTDACILSRNAVQDVLHQNPDAALRLVAALAQRLAKAEQLIGDLSLRDVGQRLAAELCRRATHGSPAPRGGILVNIEETWADLATKLGTTPESLSRRLKTLADNNIIQREEGARSLIILDKQELKQIAGLEA